MIVENLHIYHIWHSIIQQQFLAVEQHTGAIKTQSSQTMDIHKTSHVQSMATGPSQKHIAQVQCNTFDCIYVMIVGFQPCLFYLLFSRSTSKEKKIISHIILQQCHPWNYDACRLFLSSWQFPVLSHQPYKMVIYCTTTPVLWMTLPHISATQDSTSGMSIWPIE